MTLAEQAATHATSWRPGEEGARCDRGRLDHPAGVAGLLGR